METIIVQPKTEEQMTALMAVIKAFKIDFKYEPNPYNSELVDDILQARNDINNGKGVKIASKDLWK
jgi:hypothetical protein